MSEIISTSARLSLNTLSLTDSELQRVGKLIYQHAGIVVNAQKREMIFNRLSRRVRTLGLATFSDYIGLLESHSEHPEWQNFINALTTNLTSFSARRITSRSSRNMRASARRAIASGVPPRQRAKSPALSR